MAASVGANKLSVVTSQTNGTTIAFPDVCKTPSPGGPVPIPYPNVSRSSDVSKAAKKVKADGNPICTKDSIFSTSTGDEGGTAGGGVASNCTKGKAEFVNCSFDVKVEGQGAPRSFDLMLHNKQNTPPFPLLQGPVVAIPKQGARPKCLTCGEEI
jgi:hypothetical protein